MQVYLFALCLACSSLRLPCRLQLLQRERRHGAPSKLSWWMMQGSEMAGFRLAYIFDTWCISSEPEYLDAYHRQRQSDQEQQQQGTGHHEHAVRYLRLSHPVKHPGLVRNAGVCVPSIHPHFKTSIQLTCVHSRCTHRHNSSGSTAGGNGSLFLTMMTNGQVTSSNFRSACVCVGIIETTVGFTFEPVGCCR